MGVNFVIASFFLISGSLAIGRNDNEICSLPKESGNCGSSVTRYFFHKDRRQCETFTYTGCGGNANNFAYKYACERSCPGDLDLGDICSLDAEPGIPGKNISCMGYFPRYYFNKKSGKCEQFIFGGCGGNHNRFLTVEECEEFCKTDSKA